MLHGPQTCAQPSNARTGAWAREPAGAGCSDDCLSSAPATGGCHGAEQGVDTAGTGRRRADRAPARFAVGLVKLVNGTAVASLTKGRIPNTDTCAVVDCVFGAVTAKTRCHRISSTVCGSNVDVQSESSGSAGSGSALPFDPGRTQADPEGIGADINPAVDAAPTKSTTHSAYSIRARCAGRIPAAVRPPRAWRRVAPRHPAFVGHVRHRQGLVVVLVRKLEYHDSAT